MAREREGTRRRPRGRERIGAIFTTDNSEDDFHNWKLWRWFSQLTTLKMIWFAWISIGSQLQRINVASKETESYSQLEPKSFSWINQKFSRNPPITAKHSLLHQHGRQYSEYLGKRFYFLFLWKRASHGKNVADNWEEDNATIAVINVKLKLIWEITCMPLMERRGWQLGGRQWCLERKSNSFPLPVSCCLLHTTHILWRLCLETFCCCATKDTHICLTSSYFNCKSHNVFNYWPRHLIKQFYNQQSLTHLMLLSMVITRPPTLKCLQNLDLVTFWICLENSSREGMLGLSEGKLGTHEHTGSRDSRGELLWDLVTFWIYFENRFLDYIQQIGWPNNFEKRRTSGKLGTHLVTFWVYLRTDSLETILYIR